METTTQITSLKQAIEAIVELQTQVKELQAKVNKTNNQSQREMTDDDAFLVTYGDHAELKHKEVAEKLNLSYGQIYSCRLEFTFKNVHKKAKESGKTNRWVK